jgi:GNAT superfamily N-acetyltransferase
MPFRILPYEPRHAPYVASLNKEWLTAYFFVEPDDELVLSDPQKYLIDKGSHILMAELDGMPVGTCTLLYCPDGEWEFAKMAVTASARGLGIGRKLGEAVIALAKEKRLSRLYIVTNSRLEAAGGLYRKLGFVESSCNRHSRYARGDRTLELTI